MPEKITFGTVSFHGTRYFTPEFPQTLQRIGVGGEIERPTQDGLSKAFISDYSGGLVGHAGIADWRNGLNLIWRNEGLQCRAGVPVLPYLVTNQTSMTSDEDISSGIASNWRRHEVRTSLGDTEERIYIGFGHKVFRNVGNGNSALEVCYTTTDVITGLALHNVNGTQFLTVYTLGATNDVEYVADPTGTWSGNMTKLVALSAGDYIIPLGRGYFGTVGPGINVMCGQIGGVNGMWWMNTTTAAPWTMRPLVLTSTRDQDGGGSASNTGAVSPGGGSFVPGSGETGPIGVIEVEVTGYNEDAGELLPEHARSFATGSRWTPWANTGNIVSSNDSRASATFTHAQATASAGGQGTADPVTSTADGNQLIRSDILAAVEFDFSAIPMSAIGVGYVIAVERLEANAADDITTARVQLFLDGSPIGENRADGAELPTTEASASYGGTTDSMGTNLKGEQLRRLGCCVQFISDDTVNHSGTASVDHITLTIYYRELGTAIALPTGGYPVQHNPVFPHRAVIVAPRATDETSILQPRELWFIDLEWQADQERPTMRLSQPNEGMPYVWQAEPFQGGYVITGGSKAADRGITLKHLTPGGTDDRNGDQLRDFAFPGVHGSEAVKITCMYAVGSWLLLGVTDSDNGDFQWWWWNAGKYFPDTILQSLTSLAISAEPVPIASGALNTQDARVYCIFPNSSDTAVRREFCPPDPGQDPRLVNLAENRMKADSDNNGTPDRAVRLTGLEQNFGPEEAAKSIAVLQYTGRRVSAATGASYGSVTIDLDTGGDTAFGTPEVSKEFTSAFEEYEVPTSGVAYKSVIPRIGLTHDNSSVDSPDGVPILITTVQRWPHLQIIDVLVDNYHNPNFAEFIEDMYTLSEAKPTQPLKIGTRTYNVDFYGPVDLPSQNWPEVPPFGDVRAQQPFSCLLRFYVKPGTTS